MSRGLTLKMIQMNSIPLILKVLPFLNSTLIVVFLPIRDLRITNLFELIVFVIILNLSYISISYLLYYQLLFVLTFESVYLFSN